jgi:hypothetical protein
MVENNIDTNGRWYVHADNIDWIGRNFYHLKNITQFDGREYDNLNLFEIDKSHSCRIYEHDTIRPLTISEYITLGVGLRTLNRRYNKKKDLLTALK